MKNGPDVIKLNVLEERVGNMCNQNTADHGEILKRIEGIDRKLDDIYLTTSEFNTRFEPVQKIAFGLVGLACIAVVGAIINMVIK